MKSFLQYLKESSRNPRIFQNRATWVKLQSQARSQTADAAAERMRILDAPVAPVASVVQDAQVQRRYSPPSEKSITNLAKGLSITNLAKGLYMIHHDHMSSAHEETTGDALTMTPWEQLSASDRAAHEHTARSAYKAIKGDENTRPHKRMDGESDSDSFERLFDTFQGIMGYPEHTQIHPDVPADAVARHQLIHVQQVLRSDRQRFRRGRISND